MKPSLSPRKRPGQERSQITVEALVIAATRVFQNLGFSAASTNGVAELAGVSVGSLYQYFPNKLALLAAVRERLQEEFLSRMTEASLRGCQLSFDLAVRTVAQTSAAFHAQYTALIRIFISELPSMPSVDVKSTHGARYQEAQEHLFEAHADCIKVPRGEALFFMRNAGKGIMHAAVMFHPEQLLDGTIAKQVADAFTAYLSKDHSTVPAN